MNEEFSKYDIHAWDILKRKLEDTMMNKANRLQNVMVSRKVIQTYLEEVEDPSKI